MNIFPRDILYQTPDTFPAGGFIADGVKPIFYEGPAWNDRPTRVFAWYGIPPSEPGQKLPAMVLVHGGGGTAFADWVRLWNSRGYAALAMDTCGGVPAWHETPYSRNPWPRHAHSGPRGWGLDAVSCFPELPPEEQWPYHAVSAVVLGHSLLRSFPEVDPARIGITGVSWGGYLTCLAAGVDDRFAFAAPVYGCGFLDNDCSGLGVQLRNDKERPRLHRWCSLWDPSHYLPAAKMPMLWVNGTNDFAFPMDSMRRSYRAANSERHLAIRVRMPHGHGGAGEKPPEIHAIADMICRKTAPLPVFTQQGNSTAAAWAEYVSARPVQKAELNFTRAEGHWTDRFWNTVPAEINAGCRVSAALPHGATTYFFNIFYDDGCVASTEHVLPGEAITYV
ncbi:MAG: prolyl oligopeptidase family serine peptidase [Spirochaetes bacterium]|nr:prolyl oligopeptidase family serine peptidase [Spirochaetota bacterium]